MSSEYKEYLVWFIIPTTQAGQSQVTIRVFPSDRTAKSRYQTGDLGIELLTPSGSSKDPMNHVALLGDTIKFYDKSAKGNVYLLDKLGNETCIQFPPRLKDKLGLIQPFLCIQIQTILEKNTSIEVVIADSKQRRYRLHVSSSFRSLVVNELHAQIPWKCSRYHQSWCNLVFDLPYITGNCFPGVQFSTIDSIVIKPACRVRKVFTLPGSSKDGKWELVIIPPNFDFQKGVSVITEQLTVDSNDSKHSTSQPHITTKQAMTSSEEHGLIITGQSTNVAQGRKLSLVAISEETAVLNTEPTSVYHVQVDGANTITRPSQSSVWESLESPDIMAPDSGVASGYHSKVNGSTVANMSSEIAAENMGEGIFKHNSPVTAQNSPEKDIDSLTKRVRMDDRKEEILHTIFSKLQLDMKNPKLEPLKAELDVVIRLQIQAELDYLAEFGESAAISR